MNIHNFQIEPVEGCTRRCDFCGINMIRNKRRDFKFMKLYLADNIARQIHDQFKQNIRIEFAVHGEPLLHPDIVDIIAIFRNQLLKSQLTIISNGDVLVRNKKIINELFLAGLNFLMVDFYDSNKVAFVRNKRVMDNIKFSGIDTYNFYTDNIHPWTYRGHKNRNIIITPPLDEYSGKRQTRIIHTAGGNLPKSKWNKYGINKNKFPVHARCAKPFREMTINYDGNVSLCCEDWQRQAIIDNIRDKSIIDIWNSKKFNIYRYLLYNRRRDLINICKWCNERSFRTGFLKLDNNQEYPELLKSDNNKFF